MFTIVCYSYVARLRHILLRWRKGHWYMVVFASWPRTFSPHCIPAHNHSTIIYFYKIWKQARNVGLNNSIVIKAIALLDNLSLNKCTNKMIVLNIDTQYACHVWYTVIAHLPKQLWMTRLYPMQLFHSVPILFLIHCKMSVISLKHLKINKIKQECNSSLNTNSISLVRYFGIFVQQEVKL